MKLAGLFAGIGGIEHGFHVALGTRVSTEFLCESWAPARAVLADRFPGTELHPDVRQLSALPRGIDVLTAGFPCTDLSQAGRTAGIGGAQSGLVAHLFAALRVAHSARQRLPWLLVENVPNMLALDRGRAMAYVVDELDSIGYRWAYRVVDSRFTGLPQRRRRVILLASANEDPRPVLFADDAGPRPATELKDNAFGFYWTEGRGGLGWAQDAVPTLKGGSTIGIPSPPAVWVPEADVERRFVVPAVEDAEALQGFSRGWTSPTSVTLKTGTRWKLVGNAVTTRVSAWLAQNLSAPKHATIETTTAREAGQPWPTAAWGEAGHSYAVDVSEFPRHLPYEHLGEHVDLAHAAPLSRRAATGFRRRLMSGNLGRHPRFREDVREFTELGTLPSV